MEYFFRNHQRVVKTFQAAAILLLSASLESSAFSADQSANQSTATASTPPQIIAAQATLDFANGLYARKMYGPAITEYEKFLRANPDSPDASAARFRYADSFYFSKDYAGAIAHFSLFLKAYPGDKRVPLANFRMGTARFYQGDRSRAIRTFVRLSRSAEDPLIRVGSKFYLAKCLQDKGKDEKGLRLLEKLIKESPQNEYASYAGAALGDYYVREGNFSDALRGYSVPASNQNPSELTRQAKFKVAEIHFSQKNYADAAIFYGRIFEEPIKADDLKDKALLGLFHCDYNQSKLEEAEKRYAQNQAMIEASAYKSEVMLLLANLLADGKKYEEALKKIDGILSDPSADGSIKEKAGFKKVSVLSQKGEKELSLAELEKIFSSSAKSADKALFEKGQLLAEIGKTEEALAAYRQVVEGHPASEYAKNALYQSAVVRMKAGQTDEAKQSFREFASRHSQDVDAELALLQVVQVDLDAKKFNDAFEGAEAFIQTHPSSPILDIAYYKLGVAAAGLGRFGHAAVVFQKVVDGHPSSKLYVEALYGAAVSLENARKIADAIPLFERLLRDSPEHPLSAEVRPRLGYLYIQNRDNGKVLTYYEDLIFKNKDVKIDTDGIFWLFQYLLDQGLYDRLGRILGGLEERFPDKNLKHEILFFKGESAMGMKDHAQAAEWYAQAIQVNAEGAYVPHAYLGRGTALAAMGQDAEAAKELSEALKYDREINVTIRARFELANLLLKAGQWEEAAKGFMLVAILYDDPKYTPPALYKAGECFRNIGKTGDAEKAFLELRTKYPESEWSRKAGEAQ